MILLGSWWGNGAGVLTGAILQIGGRNSMTLQCLRLRFSPTVLAVLCLGLPVVEGAWLLGAFFFFFFLPAEELREQKTSIFVWCPIVSVNSGVKVNDRCCCCWRCRWWCRMTSRQVCTRGDDLVMSADHHCFMPAALSGLLEAAKTVAVYAHCSSKSYQCQQLPQERFPRMMHTPAAYGLISCTPALFKLPVFLQKSPWTLPSWDLISGRTILKHRWLWVGGTSPSLTAIKVSAPRHLTSRVIHFDLWASLDFCSWHLQALYLDSKGIF